MALADAGSLGTAQNKNTGTSLAVGTAAALEAGNAAYLVCATDNIGTTDAESNEHTSATYGGNAMTKVAEFRNGQGAAAGGATVSVWLYVNDTGSSIAAASTAQVNFSATTTGRTLQARELTRDTSKTLEVVSYSTNATDGADAPSMASSGLTNEEHLHLRAIAAEGVATLTATSGWTSIGGNATSGGGAATNMAVVGEFKISTSTGETSDPTLSATSDQASILAVFREVTAGTAWDPGTRADALSITDAITLSVGKQISDTAGITDSPALLAAMVRQIDDALGVTDANTPSLGLIRTQADPAGITDATQQNLGKEVNPNDALGITDANALDRGLTQADALGITDAAALAQGKVLADALGITDLASPAMTFAVTVPDALGITDSANAMIVVLQQIDDALALTDARAIDQGKVFADALGLTDAAATTATLVRAVADALGLTDAQVLSQGKALAESLGLTDSVLIDAGGGLLPAICEPFTIVITDPGYLAAIMDQTFMANLADYITTAELDDIEPDADFGCPEP